METILETIDKLSEGNEKHKSMVISKANMTFKFGTQPQVVKEIDLMENVVAGKICTEAGNIIEGKDLKIEVTCTGMPNGTARLEITVSSLDDVTN